MRKLLDDVLLIADETIRDEVHEPEAPSAEAPHLAFINAKIAEPFKKGEDNRKAMSKHYREVGKALVRARDVLCPKASALALS